MSGKKVTTKVEELVAPILSQMGYELVDVEYQKQKTGMALTIVIDSANGINITDCELVSHAIDKPLDELDPTNGEFYYLNVSSPGLDRPLKKEADFKRNSNKEVEVKFYEPRPPFNQKNMFGILKEWDDKTVSLIIEKENIVVTIPRETIAQIVPVIKF